MTAPLPAGVLPRGVRGRAHLLAEAAAALLSADTERRWRFDPLLLDAHLVLPQVIAAANDLAPPPPPDDPLAAPGGGWVVVDLGPDDGATWATLCRVLADECAAGTPPVDAEQLARRAQEWRLAVTPYRCADRPESAVRGEPGVQDAFAGQHDVLEIAAQLLGTRTTTEPTGPAAPACPPGPAGNERAPLRGVRIVDLTAMWAGPLATCLAAHLGAEVIKVEAPLRRDGLRRSPRPAAAGPGAGALFVALDQGKAHRELDLGRPSGLDTFLAMVAEADVVIDSFSPRVRPNLGIDPDRLAAVRPGLIDLSITAFEPSSAEASWVAYGSGVHASSGLGVHRDADGRARCVPAAVAYPDPLCGLGAFAVMLAALRARRAEPAHAATGGPAPAWRFPLSLAGAIRPIVRRTPAATAHDPSALPRWLPGAVGRTVVRDGCRVLPSPFLLDPAPSVPRETS